jgi:hypothetical protein
MTGQEDRGRGRPTDYRPEFAEEATLLCEGGATDADLAEHFGVVEKTIRNWRLRVPAFRAACRLGKDAADDLVEDSLFRLAAGTGDAAANVTACIYWLNNRRPDRWRNRSTQEVSGPGGAPMQIEGSFTPLEAAKRIARVLIEAQKAPPAEPQEATSSPPDDGTDDQS